MRDWPLKVHKKQMPRWRVGRHLGRTLYIMDSGGPSRDDDTFIGVMDTEALAQFVCHCVNEHYDRGK